MLTDNNLPQKVEMARLGNRSGNSSKDRKAMNDYVLGQIEGFNTEAWEMFATMVKLDIEEFKADKDFWEKVIVHINRIDFEHEEISWRAVFRLCDMVNLYYDVLDLLSEENELDLPPI